MLTTLPNLLTLSRIIAVPLVVATFYVDPPVGPWAGCIIFALAGFTDWLDGRLARAWQQQSAWGQFLDPIADKVLVAATLLMLTAMQRIADWAVLPAVVILVREILHAKFLGEGLLWIAAALTLVTGYQYLRAGIVHVGVEEDRRQQQAQS